MDTIEILKKNENIEMFHIPLHTNEWYDFRLSGIGASEIGYVLRKSDWKDCLPVYEEKVGIKTIAFDANENMVMGTYLEKVIADIWTSYDLDGNEYWKHLKNGVQIRRCISENTKGIYFRNKKYPWLFCSLDALIPAGEFTLNGEILQKPGVLEIKNQRSWVTKKWTLGIPPEYLYQIHQIMIILELDYGEIATLIDGCHLQVIPIPRIEEIVNDLLHESHKFWYDHVLPAKDLKQLIAKAYFDNDVELATRLQAKIYDYEPPLSPSRAYIDYLAETPQVEPVTLAMSTPVYNAAMTMKKIDALIKELGLRRDEQEAIIRHHFRVKEGNVMDFGQMGTLRLSTRKGAQKSTLYNNVNDDSDKEIIESYAKEQIEKLDFVYL